MSILQNKIYASIIGFCEEKQGHTIGNGHHLAQELTNLVAIGLLPKGQRMVYDALESNYQTTKQISEKTGVPINVVSVHLSQICKTTTLAGFIELKNGKMGWRKY